MLLLSSKTDDTAKQFLLQLTRREFAFNINLRCWISCNW